MQLAIFYGRVLPLLRSILAHMGINLGAVWLKDAFHMCMGLFMKPRYS